MKTKVEQTDDILAKASQELEESIQQDQETETAAETHQTIGEAIVKAVKDAAAPFLSKAQTSTLSAEKDRRGSLTESKSDPAATPKKSGKGYEDSSVYEARKGEDMDEDDDSDDDKKSSKKSKKKNPFFSKMKKMKKGYDEETEEDDSDDESEDMFDATEVVAELGENVESISKSVQTLEEGMAVFGELLGEMADRSQNGQPAQQHMSKHQIEVWGPNAKFLASIPQGHTIMGEGKFQNYKYKGQNGQELWGTKISVFTFGNCGPSQYGQQNQQQGYQQQQTGGYQQQSPPPVQNNNYPPQGGYGAAPSYPPQNQAPQQGGYPPPQQNYPPQGVNPNYPPQGVAQNPPAQQPPQFNPNEPVPF